MSAFSENVRGAQALVGYIYPLIFLPAMALMYLDINSLPMAMQAVFYAIPYSHPIHRIQSSRHRRLPNRRLWHRLRRSLHVSHNVRCFAIVCYRENFDCKVGVG